MGCRAWRCGSPFSPADPGQSFFTHPTQRLRCNRLPGTRPFPRWRWRPNISWSFRACSFVPSRSSLDQSKRARVKEHRLSENTIGLVCRLPRAQGLTRLIHPILVCALGEHERPTGFVLFPTPPPTACRRNGPPAASAGRPWPAGLSRPVRRSGSLPCRPFARKRHHAPHSCESTRPSHPQAQ